MKTQSKAKPAGSGRLVLLLVAAIFFLPVAGSILLFQSGWRPASQINHGELVQPARPVEDVVLKTLDGQELRFSRLRKKWTMLYFGPADCDAVCQRQLYLMRQVHIAQGAESDRVQRVYVATRPGSLEGLRKDYPNMRFLTGNTGTIKKLAQQFALPAGSPLDMPARIYVVDPAGNFMMSYPADAQGEGMRRDLGRLLKISKTD